MISSPSVKIQIMGGKVCSRCKGKTLLGIVNKLFKTKCFALLPLVNFPANDLNFHWRWWDRIKAIFLNLLYFNSLINCFEFVCFECESSNLLCWDVKVITSNLEKTKRSLEKSPDERSRYFHFRSCWFCRLTKFSHNLSRIRPSQKESAVDI